MLTAIGAPPPPMEGTPPWPAIVTCHVLCAAMGPTQAPCPQLPIGPNGEPRVSRILFEVRGWKRPPVVPLLSVNQPMTSMITSVLPVLL